MLSLSARKRQQLRDRIARTAHAKGKPNPLVTRDEKRHETEDLIPIILEHYQQDPDNWGPQSVRFTRKPRVDETPKKKRKKKS